MSHEPGYAEALRPQAIGKLIVAVRVVLFLLGTVVLPESRERVVIDARTIQTVLERRPSRVRGLEEALFSVEFRKTVQTGAHWRSLALDFSFGSRSPVRIRVPRLTYYDLALKISTCTYCADPSPG